MRGRIVEALRAAPIGAWVSAWEPTCVNCLDESDPCDRCLWDDAGLTLPPAKNASALTEQERWQVFADNDFRCVGCGSRSRLTVDHIQARANGGNNARDNLQTLCRSCNSRKGAR